MKILVIANRGQYNHRIYRTLKYLGVDAKLVQNSMTIDDVTGENPEAIVIGGGPYLDEIGNSSAIIEEFFKEMPILGICLGLQLIAKTFGGDVRTANVGEYANCKIIVDSEDDILKGVGPSFNAWVSHKDEVSRVPDDFTVLAHSKNCEVEAMAHGNYPLYGVQFHPEVEHTQKGPKIFKNFVRIIKTGR